MYCRPLPIKGHGWFTKNIDLINSMIEFEFYKIPCENCGKIKKIIFEKESKGRDFKLDIIINSNELIYGKLPAIDEFCKGYCDSLLSNRESCNN